MKMRMQACFAALVVVVASGVPAQDLKGVRIGMTKDDYDKVMESVGYFTIGGVSPKYSVTPAFDEQGKLSSFIFFFRSEDYGQVREAVKTKFPKLKCVQSKVGNRMEQLSRRKTASLARCLCRAS